MSPKCTLSKISGSSTDLYFLIVSCDLLQWHWPHFYRPQTKSAKVMFLHVSVILSTGVGCLVRGRSVWSRGGLVWGVSGLGGLLLGVSGPGGCLLAGEGACSWGVIWSQRGLALGGCLLWGMPGGETPLPPWLLLRAVRILLECILVMKVLNSKNFFHLFFTHRLTVTKAQTLYRSRIGYLNCINLNLSLFSTVNGDTHF